MQTERFPGQNKPLMVGLFLTGLATVVVVGLLLVAELLTGAVAFKVINRRS